MFCVVGGVVVQFICVVQMVSFFMDLVVNIENEVLVGMVLYGFWLGGVICFRNCKLGELFQLQIKLMMLGFIYVRDVVIDGFIYFVYGWNVILFLVIFGIQVYFGFGLGIWCFLFKIDKML